MWAEDVVLIRSAAGLGCLCGKYSFGLGAVALTRVTIFLEGVLHCDRRVANKLTIHGCDSRVRVFKGTEFDKTVTLRLVCKRVAHYEGSVDYGTKGGKSVMQ